MRGRKHKTSTNNSSRS